MSHLQGFPPCAHPPAYRRTYRGVSKKTGFSPALFVMYGRNYSGWCCFLQAHILLHQHGQAGSLTYNCSFVLKDISISMPSYHKTLFRFFLDSLSADLDITLLILNYSTRYIPHVRFLSMRPIPGLSTHLKCPCRSRFQRDSADLDVTLFIHSKSARYVPSARFLCMRPLSGLPARL
jgi:hypothetical protein